MSESVSRVDHDGTSDELCRRAHSYVKNHGVLTLICSSLGGSHYHPSANLGGLFDITASDDRRITIRRSTTPYMLVYASDEKGQCVDIDQVAAKTLLGELRRLQVLQDLADV